jgi:NAD(P)-dependent dehydrogenase (short-subunit alcohol dehydrogenase family)
MSFDGKVALVTGGGSGIGEATAKQLAAEGAAVVVTDIDQVQGERVVAEIGNAGGTASFFRADVSAPEDVTALVDHAVRVHGGLNLAMNNVGIGGGTMLLHEFSVEIWDRVVAVCARSCFLCMRAEIPHFLERGGGAIVNIASGAGLKGTAGLSVYAAAKHAVVGLTRSGALDYAKQNIRVNAIAPGPIATHGDASQIWAKTTPMGRTGRAVDIAECAVFLLSDRAPYVTGAVWEVDGGYMQGSMG